MNARFCAVALAAAAWLGLAEAGSRADECTSCVRAGDTQKGSLLIFSRITLRWGVDGGLKQDTFIEFTNDFPESVRLKLYFVNGDGPLAAAGGERAHPGWNSSYNEVVLTGNAPTYWSSATGLPLGISPFSILDQGPPPGRPAADGSGDRVLEGFLLAWAINDNGAEISWNHLSGKALLLDYTASSAWEYEPWAFRAHGVERGQPTLGPAGVMLLNGGEYDLGFGQLLVNFPAVGAQASAGEHTLQVEDVELTLHTLMNDLRAQGFGLTTTNAEFVVWNMNEVKLTGLYRLITCWYQTRLSAIGIPNHFLLSNLHTDRGKMRIEGLPNLNCANPVLPASLLGVVATRIRFGNQIVEEAGAAVTGMGCEEAAILYDVTPSIPPSKPVEAQGRAAPAEADRQGAVEGDQAGLSAGWAN